MSETLEEPPIFIGICMETKWDFVSTKLLNLLSEIRCVGLTDEQYDYLTESMNLKSSDIDELLNIAENVWNAVKVK